jgi:hypothetical protein
MPGCKVILLVALAECLAAEERRKEALGKIRSEGFLDHDIEGIV